jgi:GNAT superfamily N-acetyltransferase
VEGARLAERGDGEQCAQLCREALESVQAMRGGALFLRREAGLVAKALLRPGGMDRLISDNRRRVIVGTVDGSVVGFAVGRVDQVGEAAIGIVDALYVDPGCRGVGVGHSMLHGLLRWFEGTACRGVDVSALPGDRPTKNFFEAEGFKGRLITMHKTLG